jgi:hypothetical protein
MLSAMVLVDFADASLVTSGILKTTNQKVRILSLLPSNDRPTRERFMVTRITEAFTTSHCLHMEWDSRVLNPKAFQQDWLQYDYIGAPWKHPIRIMDYPVCTHLNCVGNSGFALISKKLADILTQVSHPDPSDIADAYVCLKLRPELEAMGIRFAPEHVAERFSCEDRRYTGQFGWHGKGTAKRNRFVI